MLIMAGAGLNALSPLALSSAVNAVSRGSLHTALIAIIIYAVLLGLARACSSAATSAHTQVTRLMQRAVAEQAYAHILALPHAYFLKNKAGEIGRHVQDGVQGIVTVLVTILMSALPFVIEIGTVIIVLIAGAFPPQLVLVLLAFMVGYGLVFEQGFAKQRDAYRAATKANAEAAGIASDALTNHETIKLFGQEDYVHAHLSEALARGQNFWLRLNRAGTITSVVLALLLTLAMGCILLLIIQEIARGELRAGAFVLINVYLLQVVAPVERLGYMARELTRGLDMAGRLRALMEEPQEKDQHSGRKPLTGTGALSVAIKGLSFSYESRRQILKEVSFSLAPGKTLAIVGQSGSGKSTIARLLLRLYPADSGNILFNGEPICDLDLASLRDAIAVVPQDSVLFHDTLLRNVSFGRPDASQTDIDEAAHRAGLDKLLTRLPDGWATVVGERGLRLSGGERQRVAIARAILKRPRLLILDEATSSLDTRTERAIQSNLVKAAQGITTLAIAHRLSTIRDADEIIVLEHGNVIERGNHDTLLSAQGYYADLWHAQQAKAAAE